MDDTLIFHANGLRKHGLPVIYKNCAIPSLQGNGVIVDPRTIETGLDDEDNECLVWWRGEYTFNNHGVDDIPIF